MPEPAPTPRPGYRMERDPLGWLEVPEDAYWGVQAQRAIHNFPISGMRPNPALVRAAVQVKKAAARANHSTGRLPDHLYQAIVQAADEVLGLAPDSGTPEGRRSPAHAWSTASGSIPSRPAPASATT